MIHYEIAPVTPLTRLRALSALLDQHNLRPLFRVEHPSSLHPTGALRARPVLSHLHHYEAGTLNPAPLAGADLGRYLVLSRREYKGAVYGTDLFTCEDASDLVRHLSDLEDRLLGDKDTYRLLAIFDCDAPGLVPYTLQTWWDVPITNDRPFDETLLLKSYRLFYGPESPDWPDPAWSDEQIRSDPF